MERHEGKAIVLKKWDERKLAYEIHGEKRGLYVICFFTAPSASVAAIERDVELSDQVLRVMVTKADHLNAEEMAAVEPQPIIPREERNPWDRPMGRAAIGPRRDRPGDDRPVAIAREDRPWRCREDESARGRQARTVNLQSRQVNHGKFQSSDPDRQPDARSAA